MSTGWKALLLCSGITAVFFVGILASGVTFGQRCGRAFPNDALAQELCVERLSHGKTIDDLALRATNGENK